MAVAPPPTELSLESAIAADDGASGGAAAVN